MQRWKRSAAFAMFASLCLTLQAFAANTYIPDVSHSLVGFTARHFVITKVRGKFNDFSATIVYDALLTAFGKNGHSICLRAACL